MGENNIQMMLDVNMEHPGFLLPLAFFTLLSFPIKRTHSQRCPRDLKEGYHCSEIISVIHLSFNFMADICIIPIYSSVSFELLIILMYSLQRAGRVFQYLCS